MNLEQEVQKLRSELEHLKQDPRLTLRDTGLIWERTKTAESLTFESVYPYLAPKGNCFGFDNGQSDKNVLIEGDNLHALQIMQYTHKEAVDVIYIDPPYNTGNKDFVYNDRFVKSDDGYKHSKWLEFMYSRLLLARNLLSPTGIILISIDENEIFNLGVLCNQIFGEKNFVENFIWVKNSGKNLSSTTNCKHEYVLCYARNKNTVKSIRHLFRIQKNGYNDAMALYARLISIGASYTEIEKQLKELYKTNTAYKGLKLYENCDHGGIYCTSDMGSPSGKGPRYELYHPITGKACKIPSRGWLYAEKTMLEKVNNDMVRFGPNENTVPRIKKYLHSVETNVIGSVIENYADGAKDLSVLFGSIVFNNTKPVSLIEYLLSFTTSKSNNSTILDFFAGSGTTGHAVMELNREDGGNRKYILVTNNENNICEEVCYERLKRANEKFDYQSNLEYLKVETLAFDAEKQDVNDIKDTLKDNILTTIQFKEMRFKISNLVSGLYQLEGCTNPTYIINVEHIDAVEEISKTLLTNSANDICVYWITMSAQNTHKINIERALKSYKNLIDLELPIGYIKVLNDFVFGGTKAASAPSLPEQEYNTPLAEQEITNYNEDV